MEINADETYVNLNDDGDYPISVYFRDESADYCFSLCRHNHCDADDGEINLMIRDQIHANTTELSVVISPTKLEASWTANTAAKLLNVDRITVNFPTPLDELDAVREALADMFRDIPGFHDDC